MVGHRARNLGRSTRSTRYSVLLQSRSANVLQPGQEEHRGLTSAQLDSRRQTRFVRPCPRYGLDGIPAPAEKE